MARYTGPAAELFEWTPEAVAREVKFEGDELDPLDIAAREWAFDPAFPMSRVGSNTDTAPWDRADAIEFLETETGYRKSDYGPQDDYYEQMYEWWQGAAAHNAPIVIFESATIPGLFTISGGHHRFACAAKRGWGTIPAIVGYLKRSQS